MSILPLGKGIVVRRSSTLEVSIDNDYPKAPKGCVNFTIVTYEGNDTEMCIIPVKIKDLDLIEDLIKEYKEIENGR